MYPIKTLSKTVDDIELYIEIFASDELKDSFDKVFVDGAFVQTESKAFLLLHGNGEDGRLFSDSIEAFCGNNYVITVDSRGHGKSTRGSQKLTIDLMAEDLSKLCDELNIGKFKLLGFSDGGNIALTYAVRHPERLSALVVAGANINPKGVKGIYRFSMLVQHLFAHIFYKPDPNKTVKFELLDLMVNYPHIAPRLLKNIICPSLVIDGEHDVIRRLHTNLIANSIPNSTRACIKKSGHNVFKDRTDEVNLLISDFIINEGENNDRN